MRSQLQVGMRSQEGDDAARAVAGLIGLPEKAKRSQRFEPFLTRFPVIKRPLLGFSSLADRVLFFRRRHDSKMPGLVVRPVGRGARCFDGRLDDFARYRPV